MVRCQAAHDDDDDDYDNDNDDDEDDDLYDCNINNGDNAENKFLLT